MGRENKAEMFKGKKKPDEGKAKEERRAMKVDKQKKMPANVKKDQDRKDFVSKKAKY